MNVKEMREMTGQTQKEFAAAFGIPVGTLRRWEYGESTPAPYVLKLIADRIPVHTERMKKIEAADCKYYYDAVSGTIIDDKGTRIKVSDEIKGVNEQNLPLYVSDLFRSYYEALEKFASDCKLDKQEKILWG